MTAKLFIPTRIRVGFQSRSDTFTGKLAYVIYYDEKGKIRKEKSWDGWRDHKIDSVEFDNVPMTGFIFNKGMQRSSEWFGSGRTVFRLYSPHDFEFEINADNLINLLMHADVSKREVLEPCIFAWAGTELVLLPTNSVEYQQSVEYTNKQDLKVSAKDLVKGCRYQKKKSDEILTYIGYFDWYEWEYENGTKRMSWYEREGLKKIHTKQGKKHIFYNGNSFTPYGATVFSNVVDDNIIDNYAEIVDDFFKTSNSQPIVDIKIKLNDTSVHDNTGYSGAYQWPEMFKIEEDVMSYLTIHTGYLYGDEQYDFYAKMQGTGYSKKLYRNYKDNPGLALQNSTKIDYDSQYSYYNQARKQSTNLIALHTKLQPIATSLGYEYQTLTPTQYVHVMATLGYGKPYFVLQNGTEIKFDRYY